MRLPEHPTNPGLAALIAGAGFRSMEGFAQAVNRRGGEMTGVKLVYDHVTVKRWLTGSICQNPDVVAAVLSEAWGIPILAHAIWPQARNGAGPVPAHLSAWAAARTLEDLAAFIGSDMLTRRETLASAIGVVTGQALIDPLTRWLSTGALGLPAAADAPGRIGTSDVEDIEQATRRLAAVDAKIGGALSREAAVGQLKHAVDLVRYSSYSDAVGNRLLAAVAGLAGLVGFMSHDSGMTGPAQQYLLYGLQAAKASTDPRAPLLVARLLADLAQQLRWQGQPDTAVRLFDLALGQLPTGRNRFNLTRAVITGQKAQALAYLGRTCLPEVRGAIGLSLDLHTHASDEERGAIRDLAHRSIDTSEPELAAIASDAYLTLTKEDRRLAAEAEHRALHSLTHIDNGYGRNKVLARIRLARVRFVTAEPEQACDDGEQALVSAGTATSWMVTTRLRELYAETEPYRQLPRVQELRERLRNAVPAQP